MNSAIGIILALAIYSLIGFGFYLILKKISNRLKKRVFFPNDELSLYLAPLDIKSEEKIRKQWLWTFLISTLFSLAPFTVIVSNPQLQAQIPYQNAPLFYAVMFSVMLVAMAMVLWLVYYCAYKKRGTALLLIILISIPFAQINFYSMNFSKSYNYSNLTTTLLFIGNAIQIVYWFTSLRLRNANLKRRYHESALRLQEKFKNI